MTKIIRSYALRLASFFSGRTLESYHAFAKILNTLLYFSKMLFVLPNNFINLQDIAHGLIFANVAKLEYFISHITILYILYLSKVQW